MVPEDFVAIGKIRTAHGLLGEVKLVSYSGEWKHFERLTEALAVKGAVERTLLVESSRWAGDNLLMKFRGIEQPEEAKRLADLELWVPKNLAAPLAPGEVYLKDLIGCQLVFEGRSVATVTSYLEGGHTELLEVEKSEGGAAVVPYADRYLGNIDLTGRTIELKVDWILE
ncbi:MAG: ribosome maturation factor RimM [Spirochaetales bacterium]